MRLVMGISDRVLVLNYGRLIADGSADDVQRDPDVIRACYKAIGRIGTPEARQALDRAVNRKGLFSRKDKVAREAAEEVLKTFGTPGA